MRNDRSDWGANMDGDVMGDGGVWRGQGADEDLKLHETHRRWWNDVKSQGISGLRIYDRNVQFRHKAAEA